MQRIGELTLYPQSSSSTSNRSRVNSFFVALIVWTLLSASLSLWLPLQISIAAVFLFAGPHNWFELRYFLMRMPVRFGKSRPFFITAFVGLALLTGSYVSLPFLYRLEIWSDDNWTSVLAVWNSLLLVWIGVLTQLRSKQKRKTDWGWVFPILLALGAFNWLIPDGFSLAIVYLHPLVALWFLDLHLRRTRPSFVKAYRLGLACLPLLIGLMILQTASAPSLDDDNGLFWRITQHSGAQLLPQVSSHLLVSIHVFLEMLHYAVWILALPLLGPITKVASKHLPQYSKFWELGSLPIARHPNGYPKLVAGILIFAIFVVVILWGGFSFDYATTRDIYFTVAIAHVLAEAPFLLRML